MKIFLNGGGSGEKIINALSRFANALDKNKPILYLPLAMEDTKYDECYKWFKNEIKLMNLDKFEMVRSSEELSHKNLENYSALFIGGGNTYKLLHELKMNNNFEKIYQFLKNDGIVFGGSAGAIIFGKDINTCLLDDENNVKLTDTKGYNLLNGFSILCHLKKENFNKNLDYLLDFSNKEKVLYLPEEDTIVIDDKEIFLIGNKRYIKLENGKYTSHNFVDFKKDIFN